MKIDPAPEALDDVDLLEMLSAGLLPLTVVDDHLARFWAEVFDGITPREDLVLREGGQIAWAFRKGSPSFAPRWTPSSSATRSGASSPT